MAERSEYRACLRRVPLVRVSWHLDHDPAGNPYGPLRGISLFCHFFNISISILRTFPYETILSSVATKSQFGSWFQAGSMYRPIGAVRLSNAEFAHPAAQGAGVETENSGYAFWPVYSPIEPFERSLNV